mmetsp:Transcript_39077/g.111683  ORF Transcript_39077/g.111683 Transcript_39077/m.111683 type:complete len:240 (+) Transcript_39077:397-1116(+)
MVVHAHDPLTTHHSHAAQKGLTHSPTATIQWIHHIICPCRPKSRWTSCFRCYCGCPPSCAASVTICHDETTLSSPSCCVCDPCASETPCRRSNQTKGSHHQPPYLLLMHLLLVVQGWSPMADLGRRAWRPPAAVSPAPFCASSSFSSASSAVFRPHSTQSCQTPPLLVETLCFCRRPCRDLLHRACVVGWGIGVICGGLTAGCRATQTLDLHAHLWAPGTPVWAAHPSAAAGSASSHGT